MSDDFMRRFRWVHTGAAVLLATMIIRDPSQLSPLAMVFVILFAWLGGCGESAAKVGK